MRTSKIISVIIALLITFSFVTPIYEIWGESFPEIEEVVIPVKSDKTDKTYFYGIKKDETLYVTIEDACEIVGANLYEKKEGYYTIERYSLKMFGKITGECFLRIGFKTEDYMWNGITLNTDLIGFDDFSKDTFISTIKYNENIYIDFLSVSYVFGADISTLIFNEAYNSISVCASILANGEISSEEEIKQYLLNNIGLDYYKFESYYIISVGTPLDELYYKFMYENNYRFNIENVDLYSKDNYERSYNFFVNEYSTLINFFAIPNIDESKEFQDVLIETLNWFSDINVSSFSNEINRTGTAFQDYITVLLYYLKHDKEMSEYITKSKFDKIDNFNSKMQTAISCFEVFANYQYIKNSIVNWNDFQSTLLKKSIIDPINIELYANDKKNQVFKFILGELATSGSLESNIWYNLESSRENNYSAVCDSALKLSNYIENHGYLYVDEITEIAVTIVESMITDYGTDILTKSPDLVCKSVGYALKAYDFAINNLKNRPKAKEAANYSSMSKSAYIMNTVLNNFEFSDDGKYSLMMAIISSKNAYDYLNELKPNKEYEKISNSLGKLAVDVANCNTNYYRVPINDLPDWIKNLYGENKIDDFSISKDKFDTIIVDLRPIDYDNIYCDFIEASLIPKYGICKVNDSLMKSYENMDNISLKNVMTRGIVGYCVDDFNSDGVKELIVTVSKSNDDYYRNNIYVELYSYSSNKGVFLEDEIKMECLNQSIMYDGLEFDRCDILMNSNNEKFICLFTQQKFNGVSKDILIYKINNSNKFEFCSQINDPGYSGGRGFYLKEASDQSERVELYCPKLSENFDTTLFYNLVMNKLNKYGFDFYVKCDGVHCTSSKIYMDLVNPYICVSRDVVTSYSEQNNYILDGKNAVIERNDPYGILSNNNIENIEGFYSDGNVKIDVQGEINTKGKIVVELYDRFYVDSRVSYEGILNNQISFLAEDSSGINEYQLVFENNSIKFKFHQQEISNMLNGIKLNDIDTKLELISKTSPNYNISNWTDEMIVSAANNFLKQVSYPEDELRAFESDIKGNKVYLKNISNPYSNKVFYITWNEENDLSSLIQERACNSPYSFHLSEFLPNSSDNYFNISDYEGKYKVESSDNFISNIFCSIECYNDKSALVHVGYINGTGSKVSENNHVIDIYDINDNEVSYESRDGWGLNSYTLKFIDGKIKISGKCIKSDGMWGIPEFEDIVMMKNSISDWKKLYEMKLKESISNPDSEDMIHLYSDAMFDLVDMNNDNIPELLISSTSAHVGQVVVYSVYNNELIKLGTDGEYGIYYNYGEYGKIGYSPSHGLMLSEYLQHGYYNAVYNKLEGDKFVNVLSLLTNSGATSLESEIYYEVNGKNLTSEEFHKIRAEFDDWEFYGRKYKLTTDTIYQALNEYN